jgi:hypothetical protein
MEVFSILRSTLAEKAPPPAQTFPDDLAEKCDQHLSFWYIRHHDRKTLTNHIIPYMAGSLGKNDLPQNVMDRHSWVKELIKSELTDAVADNSTCFLQITAAFWENPRATAADLLRLSRFWFFILLRYTYRKRFFEGREISRSNFDIKDIYSNRNAYYTSEFDEDAIYRLTRLQNKYGASYYRGCYKDAKQRLGWTSFCVRIRVFCQSVGLYLSSNNPEKNLWELRHNLTAIMIHRKLSCFNSRLVQNTGLVHNTRKYVKKVDERMASSAMHEQTMIEDMKQKVQELSLQIEELRLTPIVRNEARCMDLEDSTEIVTLRTAYEKKLEGLGSNIHQNDETSKQLIKSLQSGIKELRSEFDHFKAREEESFTADALIVCRWLLEHLPLANLKEDWIGLRWKRFWEGQWDRCKKAERESHPLWKLSRDGRYNGIGKNLYGTLSKRIHGYGHQRSDRLPPDVQLVVDAIKPVHYHDNGKINLKAERARWTG